MNETSLSRFVTRKWNTVNDQSKAYYDVGNKIIYETEILKSNLCNYNKAYILARDESPVVAAADQVTRVAFKNCVPLTQCITKLDGTTIDDAENLDLFMPMHNLLEHSLNYSGKTGSLWV